MEESSDPHGPHQPQSPRPGRYGSWADLFGRQQAMGMVLDHAAARVNVAVVDRRRSTTAGGTVPSVEGEIQKIVIGGRC